MKIILITILLVLFACKEDKNKTVNKAENKTSQNVHSEKKIGIHDFERLEYRRSYVGHENLSDKEVEKLHEADPSLLSDSDGSKIVKKLNEIGLMQDRELVLSKFEDKKFKKAFLDDHKKIEISCDYYPDHNLEIRFTVNNGKEKIFKTVDLTATYLIGVILKDVDDDNIKEILIVTVGYVMNGDNFDLQILKYK